MSVQDLIKLRVLNSNMNEFSIKFLCDLYDTSAAIVNQALQNMQLYREVYQVKITDTHVVIER